MCEMREDAEEQLELHSTFFVLHRNFQPLILKNANLNLALKIEEKIKCFKQIGSSFNDHAA